MDPKVITAAASSPLGILALLILAIAGIATAYFREAPVNVRVWMFVLMLGGVGLFAASVIKQPTPAAPPLTPAPAPLQQGSPRAATPQPAQASATSTPLPAPPPPAVVTNTGAGQLFPNSSDHLLDRSDIGGLPASELRIARNEIYARHGYIFQSPDLRAYFAQFPWYKPTQTTVQLNPVEQQNIALFKNAETNPP
jgi:hypothetical protein